jgi:hypothetical protein
VETGNPNRDGIVQQHKMRHMKPSNRLLTAAAATVAVIGAAGCGSDETRSEPTAAPPITGEDAIAEISGDLQLELIPVGPQPDGSIAVNAIMKVGDNSVYWPRVDLDVPAGTTVTAGTLTPQQIVSSETGLGRCESTADTTWECYTDESTVGSVPLTMELFVTPPAGTDGNIEVTGTALFDIGIEYNERDWSLRSDPDPSNNTVTITLE